MVKTTTKSFLCGLSGSATTPPFGKSLGMDAIARLPLDIIRAQKERAPLLPSTSSRASEGEGSGTREAATETQLPKEVMSESAPPRLAKQIFDSSATV